MGVHYIWEECSGECPPSSPCAGMVKSHLTPRHHMGPMSPSQHSSHLSLEAPSSSAGMTFALQIISPDFPGVPTSNLALTASPDSIERIKRDFADVISDTMSPEPMDSPSMHNHLLPDAIPKKGWSAPHQIPLHFQKAAEATIADLLAKGVIAKVTTPMTWSSQAFFVAKYDPSKVRLLTSMSRGFTIHSSLHTKSSRPSHPQLKSLPSLTAFHGTSSSALTPFLLYMQASLSSCSTQSDMPGLSKESSQE